MAYSVVSQTVLDTGSGNQATFDLTAFTPAAGNCLLAWANYICITNSGDKTITLSDTTGSNGTWTEVSTHAFSSFADKGMRAFYLPVATNTLTTLRATYSANVDFPGLYVAEISGLAASPFLDSVLVEQLGPQDASADTITSGVTATLGAQPACIFGLCYDTALNYPLVTAGTGYTSLTGIWDIAASLTTKLARPEHKRVTATTAVAATFTSGGSFDDFNRHLVGVVALKELSGFFARRYYDMIGAA